MFLDTFAWLEYFMGGTKGGRVRERLDAADVAYTCPMVLAELTSKLTRTVGASEASARVAFVQEHCVVVEHTPELGIAAGRIHAEMKPRAEGFGMADAFVLAAARSKGVHVLTGDPHFKEFEDVELL